MKFILIIKTKIIYNYLDMNGFNSGLNVKLKKLGRISKKLYILKTFFIRNKLSIQYKKTDMFIYFSL
jgi:hypothetical protein